MSSTPQKVLLVGVSSGIGLRAAELLMEHDVIVYAAAPDVEPMRPLEERGAHLLTMDVTSAESVNAGVQKMLDEQGDIDCVLFNAGIHFSEPVETMAEEKAELIFQVNLMGAARIIRAVTPHFRQRRKGRLIFTASIVSHLSIMMSGWYAATKHAMRGLLTAFRQEVGRFGIEVVMIEPGQINSGFETATIEKLRNQSFEEDYQPLVEQFMGFTENALKSAPTIEGTAQAMVKSIITEKSKPIVRTSTDAKILPAVSKIMGTKGFDSFIVNAFNKYDPK